jgi:hypothetical protein
MHTTHVTFTPWIKTPHHNLLLILLVLSTGKYPAITDRERAISISLQVLYLAITDETFFHIANRAAPSTWGTIRQSLCDPLIHSKDDCVYEILILRASRRHIPA